LCAENLGVHGHYVFTGDVSAYIDLARRRTVAVVMISANCIIFQREER